LSRPVDSGGSWARTLCVWIQQMRSMGAPKIQRQATSRTVSEGCANTQPIWPTVDCVARTGSRCMLLDNKVYRFARHDNDLDDVLLAGDARTHFSSASAAAFMVSESASAGTRTTVTQLAVDLHRISISFSFASSGLLRGHGARSTAPCSPNSSHSSAAMYGANGASSRTSVRRSSRTTERRFRRPQVARPRPEVR